MKTNNVLTDDDKLISFVDALAQEIRRVDGNHSLGAAALAEALTPFLSKEAAIKLDRQGWGEPDRTLPYEQALSCLIDKIIPGLDSGDILADAKTASAALTAEPVKVPSAEETAALQNAFDRGKWFGARYGNAAQPAASAEPVVTDVMHAHFEGIYNGLDLAERTEIIEGILKLAAPVAAQPSVPDGWKLVPVEPSIAMCIRGAKVTDDAINGYSAAQVYAAMLHAAPTPPSAEQTQQDADKPDGTLINEGTKSAQPDPVMAGEASEYERGRKDGWAAGWDQAQAQTDPAMAGDEGMPPLDDRASYSAAHIRKLIRADRSRQRVQPASGEECVMPDIRIPGGIMTVGGDYKPGDMPPSGYLDWHEWAETQHKAGLRQVECGRCGKWRYPQELSPIVEVFTAKDRCGKSIEVSSAVCKSCAQQGGQP